MSLDRRIVLFSDTVSVRAYSSFCPYDLSGLKPEVCLLSVSLARIELGARDYLALSC